MKNIITKEGKEKLEKELAHLISVERPEVIQGIKEARAQGDLSENAEYDAARERQGKIEDRIREITLILEQSQILEENHEAGDVLVTIGSEVTIENLNTKTKNTYKIVGTLESNPFDKPIGKISNESPLAKAILNHKKNDTIKVESKNPYKVKIIDIKN